ncbi:leader peptide SpeFL [Pectobacteriaceae bacterium CE70]|nr:MULTISPECIES: leader peptide SpeFL [Enterobacterales]WJV56614.1 leader peptide SpeFL [Pectobacteriaceae bacterium C111]WJV64018.1 leader peptide SpeFL [Pectobacteriaceae bacterium C52]WJV68431.1 leader peptide SpeFL [Pectobacteriaceae bacterium CE70]WJY12360.1 leader peptide SpeFL [Pectobacteriaceae bacterium C80]WJY13686.1 leader peptide SpeFL [Pectobacteriaceae bacterium CE90]
MENNNRFMPHIRRVTHLMKMSCRSCFTFAYFNKK